MATEKKNVKSACVMKRISVNIFLKGIMLAGQMKQKI